MKRLLVHTLILIGAILVGAYLQKDFTILQRISNPMNDPSSASDHSQDAVKEILYWVAPMDPNYRREKAGKSPMGMDLVPVYKDAGGDNDNLVRIDPSVVNNLGVRTTIVEQGPLWRRINTVGYFDYDERKLSHVHVRTNGWIERLYVKSDGERVKKGDVLFEIYSRELVNAQEEYLQAHRSENRYLLDASRDRLQALGMSRAQINDIANSGKAAQLVRYYAKQDGLVDRLNIREGMYVIPNTQVMALADLSSIWLLADVYERQAGWIRVGQAAEIRLPYLPGEIWEAKVAFVYPSIDEKTRTLRVRLQLENPEELFKPEMYAEVSIFAGPKRQVLSVPREALIRTGQTDRVVMAMGEGRFSAREVVAGIESGDWIEIREGLSEGEQIVRSGQFLIDSEANLRSSIQRLGDPIHEAKNGTTAQPAVINGKGTVNQIDQSKHALNISHEAIESLGWPAMTMDFIVEQSINIDSLKPGSPIHFTLQRAQQGTYHIVALHVTDQSPSGKE